MRHRVDDRAAADRNARRQRVDGERRSAISVEEALTNTEGTLFDALISDLAMPGQDGYTLLTLMRDRLGAGMPGATIALTAYASRADRERAIAAGFREHLAKPINPDVLLQTLEDLLAEDATRLA